MFGKPIELSKEFHPVPKPAPRQKKQPKPIGAGKKTNEWKSIREQLIETFKNWGITECEIRHEGCWRNNALGFAHVDKRRNLRLGELTKVVLACTPCHQWVEVMPHKEMRLVLERIIASREQR